jgi:hypothetical protein
MFLIGWQRHPRPVVSVLCTLTRPKGLNCQHELSCFNAKVLPMNAVLKIYTMRMLGSISVLSRLNLSSNVGLFSLDTGYATRPCGACCISWKEHAAFVRPSLLMWLVLEPASPNPSVDNIRPKSVTMSARPMCRRTDLQDPPRCLSSTVLKGPHFTFPPLARERL